MTTAVSADVDRAAILDALDVELPRPKLSVLYRLGILLIAVVMLLLPLIYVALVVAAGYGTYWHATENVTIFAGSGSARGKLLMYCGPLVVGVVLVFFMVKPLFAPRRRKEDVVEVDPTEQPFLFDFVDSLCAAVGAPAPRRILVDCTPNASAGFHQGGTGVGKSGRELTIGLPLVGAMSLRQVAGILAHEFGHFSQGTGMRLSFTVAAVNAWFARVVFERDQWDQQLVEWSRSGALFPMIVSGAARGMVWLTRRLLYGLMWVGHVVSSFMSRQMEYDADQYEIGLAGSEAFSASMRELPVLGVAMQAATQVLGEKWQENRLADNMPQLTIAQRKQLPEQVVRQIEEHLEEQPGHIFATHPREIDRIRAAEAVRSDGLFQIDAPATVLLDGFDEVCRQATISYYRSMLGRRFKVEQHLVPTRELVEEHQRDAGEREALVRYFRGSVNLMRPLPLPSLPLAAPQNPKQTALEIKELRKRTIDEEKPFQEALGQLVHGHDRMADAKVARAFVSSKIKIDASSFGMHDPTPKAAREAHQAAAAAAEEAEGRMESFERLCGDRLERALCLLSVPTVAKRVENAGELQGELTRLLPVAMAVGGVLSDLARVRAELHTINRLHEPLDPEEKQPELHRAIRDHAKELSERLKQVKDKLGDLPYPFTHSSGEITVVDWALKTLPVAQRLEKLFEVASEADDRLTDLYLRVMARIVHIAERSEEAIGLKPMPVPKKAPDVDS